MPHTSSDDFLDIYFSAIPVPSAPDEHCLSVAIRKAALELYGVSNHRIAEAVGRAISKEAWVKRAKRMVINPEYDGDTAYVSVRAVGPTNGRHGDLVDLLSTHLMSKAPHGSITQRSSVSSDLSLWPTSFPMLVYCNGELVDEDSVYAS